LFVLFVVIYPSIAVLTKFGTIFLFHLDLDRIDKSEETNLWTCVLWYWDSEDYQQNYSQEWYVGCAKDGDPICQMLQSSTVGNRIPGKGTTTEEAGKEFVQWNLNATEGGNGMAAVKIARAYLHLLPSSLPYGKEIF
jgi:hypothetical protein